MKKALIIIFVFAFAATARADFQNVREIDIRPAIDAHYEDGRLLDLNVALYRLGEIVRIGPPGASQFAIVLGQDFDGKRWSYTLRSVKFEPTK